MEKKRRIKILAVVLICAVDILWAAGLIYFWKEKGIILSVRNASVFLCKLGRDYTSLCGDLRDDRNVGACMYRMCVSDLERKIRNNLAYGSAPRSHGLPCGVELRGRMRYHCQNHA